MSDKPQYLSVLPDPQSLLESMRAVGYTVEAAIADIIDNSLSAQATRVVVEYDASQEPYVAILDNGHGMSAAELTEAMRHGKDPNQKRRSDDLGRFGLGLKTASISQARRLTVISRRDGETTVRCWDLDLVTARNEWVVEVPPTALVKQLPLYDDLMAHESGTLVVWQNLDRLLLSAVDKQREITHKFTGLADHLALVFHRFTTPDSGSSAVSISLNGRALDRRDPFLTSVTMTQWLDGQDIDHSLGRILISPFVLPPIDRLSRDEIQLAGGGESLRNTQGFYVYRGRRLVIWGTWFRLTPKDEFFKLCRVKVDIPNSFDELWNLDIKKSAASPPTEIRDRLKDLIPRFQRKSKLTVTYKGKVHSNANFKPVWVRFEDKDGGIKYQVNRNHPVFERYSALLTKDSLSGLSALIDLLEGSLPLEAIYADRCHDTRNESDETKATELSNLARMLMQAYDLSFKEILSVGPFDAEPALHSRIQELLKCP